MGRSKVVDVKTLSVKEMSADLCMDIADYQHWFDAIHEDKVDYVRQVLISSGGREKERLLNGRFVYQDSDHVRRLIKLLGKEDFKVTRPLILSSLYCSHKVFASLLEFGASSDCLEESRDNLLHSMALRAARFPESEQDLMESYKVCCQVLGTERMTTLLHGENKDGLRPLESAAKLGCCVMVRAIMETPGVYLAREEKRGMLRYQWFDITEYETTDRQLDRRGKSIMGFLTMMDEKTLMKPGSKELFSWTPFKIWCGAKLHPTKILIVPWFLLRLAQIAVYFVLTADKSMLTLIGGIPDEALKYNETADFGFVFCSSYVRYALNTTTRVFLLSIMAFLGLSVVLFDLFETLSIVIRKSPRYFYGYQVLKPSVVVTRNLYRLSQFMVSFLFAFIATVQLQSGGIKFSATGMQIVNILCMINITLSVMFFCQMLPVVGIYIITVKRMLRDLLTFSFLYLLWVTPFSLYFMVFFNTNSKTECAQAFANLSESFYSTFRMMLNMLDMTSFDIQHPEIVSLMHAVYVFTVAILLINFLIAVMSTSASKIALSEDIVLQLERMHIALTLEYRLGWLLHKFLRKCKGYVMVTENSRYLLLNVEHTC